MKELPSPLERTGLVEQPEEIGVDWFEGRCIDSGCVSGFAAGSPEGKHRQGELSVQDAARETHTFKIFASHQYQIPDGSYVLLGSRRWPENPNNEPQGQFWVIGRRQSDEKFEKVSVFEMADSEEVEKLEKLGVVTTVKVFLT
ncbi:uncharacterized protein ARMOST_12163 [Armillaria ostoyae]|uniref:Uncharacterized protein n=1 Tax=Armillaria ostoyae TaxID=47428 RepID=A0A284RJ77_ARMOS|nr:uncharacterized protein ARMOST_12163 [Armillaria ostoyae]